MVMRAAAVSGSANEPSTAVSVCARVSPSRRARSRRRLSTGLRVPRSITLPRRRHRRRRRAPAAGGRRRSCAAAKAEGVAVGDLHRHRLAVGAPGREAELSATAASAASSKPWPAGASTVASATRPSASTMSSSVTAPAQARALRLRRIARPDALAQRRRLEFLRARRYRGDRHARARTTASASVANLKSSSAGFRNERCSSRMT